MGKKKVDFVKLVRITPEADLITNFMVYRFRRGYSTMILVSGARGTGKSSTCFRLSEKYNEVINPIREKEGLKKRDVGVLCRSHIDFVKFVKEAQIGDDCILEEIAVLYPNRRSMSEESVSVGMIFDIIRKKRLVVFANCPMAQSTDKTIRTTANALILTHKIIKTEEVVLSRFWKLQPNFFNGKVYTHKFKRKTPKGMKEVHFMYTKMPNKELWKWYENKKDSFIDETYDKLLRKAQNKREKELKELGLLKERKRLNPDSIQPELWKEVSNNGYKSLKLLSKKLGEKLGKKVDLATLSRNMKSMYKKGWDCYQYKIKNGGFS